MEIDHIRPEAQNHLRRGLTADAAVDIRFAGKEFAIVTAPGIGNGIAHEDDALFARRQARLVCRFRRDNGPGSASLAAFFHRAQVAFAAFPVPSGRLARLLARNAVAGT